jgi:RimJ/RimL family protein N-acetyltransferase
MADNLQYGRIFMYFKKMIGNKCYLSPFDINDAEKYTEWLNDLEITRNLVLYGKSIDLNSERKDLIEFAKGHNYEIIEKDHDILIGSCGFIEIDDLNQTAGVGIFIGDKNYWNKGYGSEALTLLLDYGFKALNFHNVELTVFSFNYRAIRSYEKVGFKIIGKRREALKRGRETFDIIYMDILENEFYERNEIIKELKKEWNE